MKLFITAKFKGDENKDEIEKLCEIAHEAGFDEFCFVRDVEKYQRGVFPDPHELMTRAREELLKCNALLIDVSDNPSGGRIIEAGMAFGNNKQVTVIAKRGSEIKVPTLGIANNVIEYDEIDDTLDSLSELAQNELMKTIEQDYTIDAPVSKVWEALTSAEIAGQWGASPAKVNPVEGGEFSYWDSDIHGTFTELIPEELIKQDWYGHDNPSWKYTVKFTLIGDEQKTTVHMTYTGDIVDEQKDISDWRDYYFDPIKKLLEG